MKKRLISIFILIIILISFKMTEIDASICTHNSIMKESQESKDIVVENNDATEKLGSLDYNYIFKAGKTYEITNIGGDTSLNNNASKSQGITYNIINYDLKKSFIRNCDSYIKINSKKTVLTINGTSDLSVYLTDDDKMNLTIKEISTPVKFYDYKVKTGNSYKIKNVSKDDIMLRVDYDSGVTEELYDIIYYNEFGEIEEYSRSNNPNIYVSKGYSADIKFINSGNVRLYVLDQNKTKVNVSSLNTEVVFKSITFKVGNNYTIVNSGDSSIEFKDYNDYYTGYSYIDSIKYNNLGNIVDFSKDDNKNISVEWKGKTEVSIKSGRDKTIYYPEVLDNLLKISTSSKSIEFAQYYLKQNEKCTLQNKSKDQYDYLNVRINNYVYSEINYVSELYNKDDKLMYTNNNLERIYIDPGQKAVVENKGAKNLEIYYPKELVEKIIITGATEVNDTLTIDSFSVNKSSPQLVGTLINLQALAKGGSGDIQYRFVVQKDGKTIYARDFSNINSATWKANSEGVYKVFFKAKDSKGKIVEKSIDYVINSNLKITKTNMSLTSPQPKGKRIRLETLVSGGEGVLQYRFVVFKNGVKTFARDYTTSNNVIWIPKEEGNYTIHFKVKDKSGKEVWLTKTFVITI